MDNRRKEMKQKEKYHEGWCLSKKYSSILMDHEVKDEHFNIASNVYHQFISELKVKNIPHTDKNYIQVWETMLNTIQNNPKLHVCRGAMKLLHQTSIQRSSKVNL